MMTNELASPEYEAFLESIKERVRIAQVRAVVAVNHQLVLLNWEIGRAILARQADLGWGAKVIDQLSHDLRRAFPDMRGFSSRNLKYMRAFAQAWPNRAIVQEALAQITWYQNVALLEKLSNPEERLWYARSAREHGWSRSVLVLQIERKLHLRQGKAVTNFERALVEPGSDLARQTLKDPYVFDFLGLGEDAKERDIEQAMIGHLKDTLVELGVGFAFVGQQVRLEVAGDEFFLDLLFYHLKLHCYIVVELKAVAFQPEHAGKLNFYLSAVDDLVRDASVDGPTIGLLLCRTKNRVVAEYALRDIDKPIGVADVQLTRLLPERLEGRLPTVEALEAELAELSDERPEGEHGTGTDGESGDMP
jgi:predicted nuclease of restriction endonuclease-like (RecB) superfamily